MYRRLFLKSVGATGLTSFFSGNTALGSPASPAPEGNTRKIWVSMVDRLAQPLLTALANDELKVKMPVEAITDDRKNFTHLEGFARLLSGISPWLNLTENLDKQESDLRKKYFDLALKGLSNATDPQAKDYMNFDRGGQALVDASFLAHGLIRCPKLWENSDGQTKNNVYKAFLSSRKIKPGRNNWLLFSGMIEAFFLKYGFEYDKVRLDYAIFQHEQWYKGDGMYGDGPDFHWDYYNSFVIQPYLTDILKLLITKDESYKQTYESIMARAIRYAEIQERLIASDGTYPIIGRSITYRAGAFQNLANIALQQKLPANISPAQVRCALTAVLKKTTENKANFDQNGWLTIGVNGHQPQLGEGYISTGSLYLCSTAFLPLGLPSTDEFWAAPDADWTSKKVWQGGDLKADHAIK